VLRAQEHEVLPAFSQVMLIFVIPLTVITLIVLTIHAIHIRRKDQVASERPETTD
jgi:cation:H+ antiporter